MGGESFHAQPVLGSAALGFVEVTATLARKQLAERMDDATLAGFFERLEKTGMISIKSTWTKPCWKPRSLLPGLFAFEERMPFTWRLPPA